MPHITACPGDARPSLWKKLLWLKEVGEFRDGEWTELRMRGKGADEGECKGINDNHDAHLLRASFHPIFPPLTEAVEEYCLTVRDLTVLGL